MSADVKAYGVGKVVKTWRVILILNLFFNNIKLILHPVRRISKVLKRNRIILFVIFFLLESAGLSLWYLWLSVASLLISQWALLGIVLDVEALVDVDAANLFDEWALVLWHDAGDGGIVTWGMNGVCGRLWWSSFAKRTMQKFVRFWSALFLAFLSIGWNLWLVWIFFNRIIR